jgi:hypothetical protein
VIPNRMMPRICGALFLLITACTGSLWDRSRDSRIELKENDPVGAWQLKCVSPDGKARECVVTISRTETALMGVCRSDGATQPVKRVAFEEGILCLEVEGRFAGQTYGLTYQGAPRGDALHGTVRWSYGWASGSFPFEGERVAQEVASAR